MVGKVLVVGERGNFPADSSLGALSDGRWLALSLRLGAFRSNPGRAKLRSVGVDLDAPGVDSLNLVPPAPQGVPFDAAKAARVAGLLVRRLGRWNVIYLCGTRVAAAFGVRGSMAGLVGQGTHSGGTRAVVLPHPSGLSRWWNDPANVRGLRRCLSRNRG